MPWSTWKRLVQKKKVMFLLTVNSWLLLTPLKACDRSGHILGVSDSPRSLTKKLAMSPSSTVPGCQHDTKYVTFELLLHAAFVADEIWGSIVEPACKHPQKDQQNQGKPNHGTYAVVCAKYNSLPSASTFGLTPISVTRRACSSRCRCSNSPSRYMLTFRSINTVTYKYEHSRTEEGNLQVQI